MTYRRLARLMWIGAATNFFLGVSIFIVALSWPIDAATTAVNELRSTPEKARAPGKEQPSITLDEFRPIWQKRLRRPFEDVVKALDTPVDPSEPSIPPPLVLPDIVLIGTAVMNNPAESRAWLRYPDSRTVLVTVEQQLESIPGGPSIKEIGERRIILLFNGQEIELEMPRTVSIE